jgi:hypothetical protein
LANLDARERTRAGRRLRFEHLVQINDPEDPRVRPMRRAELWRGLLLRAEDPRRFVYGLDAATVTYRGADFIERELDFGGRLIHDRVTFVRLEATHYAAAPGPASPAGSLSIRIEEPTPGQLFLRFSYATQALGASGDEEYAEIVQQAYFQADLDTVSRLRELLEQSRLEP